MSVSVCVRDLADLNINIFQKILFVLADSVISCLLVCMYMSESVC